MLFRSVDNLLGVLKLSDDDISQIQKELGISDFEIPDNPERLMERTSHVLSLRHPFHHLQQPPFQTDAGLNAVDGIEPGHGMISVTLVPMYHRISVRQRSPRPRTSGGAQGDRVNGIITSLRGSRSRPGSSPGLSGMTM